MQEDKERLFDALHTIKGSLRIFAGMIDTMTVNVDHLQQTVYNDFSNATELADYLVNKGVPFRSAHEIVGKIVLWRSEEHTSELQSRFDLVCRLLLEKKKLKK